MRITSRFFLITMAVVCMSGVARAGSWSVEQDGTGDFTVIQDAVDAAADGDTIYIGPGLYQDTHDYDPPGGGVIQVVVSWDDLRELIFIGSGMDQVIVGPDTYSPVGPSGFYHVSEANVFVEGIWFQNCYQSFTTLGGFEVRNCRFSDTHTGAHSYWAGGANFTILGSEFYRQQGLGASGVGIWTGAHLTMENCYFEDAKFYLQGITDFNINNCESVGRIGDFVASNGQYTSCQAEVSSNKALYIDSGSQVIIQDSVFSVSDTGTKNISISGSSTVQMYGNVFNGGSYTSLEILSEPTVVGSGNHFFKGTASYSIILQYWTNPLLGEVDLRNNYWGTDNPALVAAWILDGADDPEIAIEVQYLPMADGPMPTESMTLDGLKALYR